MADAMHEAMLDARQEGGSYRRIEVITGQRRRQQWTAEEKARIVGGELRGRGQYLRGGSSLWRCPWAAYGLAAQVRGESGPSGTSLRAGPDHFREQSGDGRGAGSAGARA
jgi:hypothetical protein